MTRKAKDPRIAIVVKVMERARYKRLKFMIEGRDARKADGHFTRQQEAAEIIAALDEHDAEASAAAFGSLAAIAKAESREGGA